MLPYGNINLLRNTAERSDRIYCNQPLGVPEKAENTPF